MNIVPITDRIWNTPPIALAIPDDDVILPVVSTMLPAETVILSFAFNCPYELILLAPPIA